MLSPTFKIDDSSVKNIGSLTNPVTETDNIDCLLSSLLKINEEDNSEMSILRSQSTFAVHSTGFTLVQ